jgi:predicted Zn-dependent protease
MKTTVQCALLAATFALSACVTQESLIKAVSKPENLRTLVAPKKMTPEEEQHMGRESAAMLLGAAPLLRDEALQNYVNRVGQRVAAQTGRSDIEWRFGILDTPNVNAFAAPAGYVLITRGLLSRLHNESELGGVLGHEIAHVVERHHAEAMRKKERSGALAKMAADATENKDNKLIAGALTNLAKGLYASGLDKGDEYDADRLGIVLATRAGYNPYGLPRVIHMHASAAGEGGFELLFSTHPSPADRLAALDKAMGDRLDRFETTGLNDTPVFRKLVAKGR